MPLTQDFRQNPIKMALWQKYNVMRAVVLRDIRTRFFDHGLGFLIVPLWPAAHMVVLLSIYHFSGRVAPYGDSLNVFFATGLVPTLLFIYVSRFMSYSLILNRPLMHFPVVTAVDVMIGRAYLETIGAALTLAMIIGLLLLLGDDPWPANLEEAICAYLAALLLAIGTGVLAGVVVLIAQFFATLYSLSMVAIYLLSGTLFVASSLPAQAGYALSWNPVLQCVEWMRVAYFPTYSDRLLDRGYVLWFGGGSLLLGLFLERVMRRQIRDN